MHDALIVGAGPGGTTAATYLAEAGLRVLVLDRARFPRDKVCGDAVSGRSIEILRDLGVADHLLRSDCFSAWGITFGAPGGDAVSIPISKDRSRPVPPAFVCPRTLFDNLLFERLVASGAEIRQEAQVEGLYRKGSRVAGVRLKGEAEPLHAPLVIGADGANSAVARGLGMPQLNDRYYAAAVRAYYHGVADSSEPEFLEIHFLDVCMPGYFWIFPLGGGRVNVGVGMLSHAVKQRGVNLKTLLNTCVEHPRFAERFREARRVGPVKGWGLPLGSRPRPMAGDGWLLVGDAASLIDPFTGEGIGNAMATGRLAARWTQQAHAAHDFSGAYLRSYERDVLTELKGELRLSHALQRLTGWRAMLNFVVGKAGRTPEVADILCSMFDDRSRRSQLFSPLFYLRLLTA